MTKELYFGKPYQSRTSDPVGKWDVILKTALSSVSEASGGTDGELGASTTLET